MDDAPCVQRSLLRPGLLSSPLAAPTSTRTRRSPTAVQRPSTTRLRMRTPSWSPSFIVTVTSRRARTAASSLGRPIEDRPRYVASSTRRRSSHSQSQPDRQTMRRACSGDSAWACRRLLRLPPTRERRAARQPSKDRARLACVCACDRNVTAVARVTGYPTHHRICTASVYRRSRPRALSARRLTHRGAHRASLRPVRLRSRRWRAAVRQRLEVSRGREHEGKSGPR